MHTIDFLKQNIAQFVHSEARVEGAGCSFAETEQIIKNGKTIGISENDVQIVLGLKHAWEYLFDNYTEDLSFEIFADYNFLIQEFYRERGGELRTENISITNTFYSPEPRSIDDFYNVINTAIDTSKFDSDRALTMLFLLCKSQFFWDGNKRSSQILVNHFLAQQDSGIYFLVPEGEEGEFHEDLIAFYEGEMSLDDVVWLDNYIWKI